MDNNRQIKGFAPINEDHSIERVSFAVNFKSAFSPQSIAAIQSGHDAWRDSLPASTGVNSHVDTLNGAMTFPTIQFAFLRPNGEPTWSMEVGRNEIRVECSLYTRWEKVWGAAFEYISQALSHVPQQAAKNNQVLSLELVVKDTFIADDSYDVAAFFNETNYIAPILLKNGPLWHCHTGWFVNKDSGDRILHNLNLNGGVVDGYEDQYFIGVEHKQVGSVSPGITIESLMQSKLGIINEKMVDLHQQNKALLVELLNSDLRQIIGLEG